MKLYAEIRQSYHDPHHTRISAIIWLSTGEDEGILLSRLGRIVEADPEVADVPEVAEARTQIQDALQTLCIEEKRVPAITGVTFG